MGIISKTEVKRQSFHIIVGTALALLFYYDYMTPLRFVMLFGLLVAAFFVYLYFKMPVIHQFIFYMGRRKEMNYFPGLGALFFIFGMILSAWLFPKDIAVASILILAWSDGIASLVGPFGRIAYINPKKNWEGLIAAIAFGTLAASFFVSFWMALAGATVAMLIEGLDITIHNWKVDDNMFVPVVAGAVMMLFGMV
ncbi:hypothetical protein HY497_01155 [Candidatus Woesearchaeota archaeon]|nr:hypothetical protein [Candidatus Woesearchaeota archaeon]